MQWLNLALRLIGLVDDAMERAPEKRLCVKPLFCQLIRHELCLFAELLRIFFGEILGLTTNDLPSLPVQSVIIPRACHEECGVEIADLCSTQGHLLSMRQEDGSLRFSYALNVPMPLQPALAEGSMFVGTTTGMVICLKTADKEADGWTAWGGNAQHNKKQ